MKEEGGGQAESGRANVQSLEHCSHHLHYHHHHPAPHHYHHHHHPPHHHHHYPIIKMPHIIRGEQMCRALNIVVIIIIITIILSSLSYHQMIIRWTSRCDTSSSAGFSGSAVVRWTVRPEVVEGGKDKAKTRSHEFLTTTNAMREGA